MKLLSPPQPAARGMLPSADTVFTLALLAWLAGLEWAGRHAATDVQDAAAAAALAVTVAVVVGRHRRRPLPWAARLVAAGRGLLARLGRLKYDHGIDLRGDPPIRRKVPGAAWAVAAAAVVWGPVAAAGWAAFPDGWRAGAAVVFYLGYLVAVAAVWAGLLAGIVLGVYVPLLLLETRLRAWFPREPDRRAAELLLLIAYMLTVVTVGSVVPTAAVLGLCLVVAAAAGMACARRGGDDAAVLWRAGPGRPVYAVPLHRLVAGAAAVLACVVFDLLLTACGGRLFGGTDLPNGMPLTSILGWLAAWFTPGLLALAVVKAAAGLRNDPARRQPVTVAVTGLNPADVRKASSVVAGWGWRVAPGGAVGVQVVSAGQSEATEFDPVWPLKVSLADLTDGRVKERLARRDEIQLRRRVFRGLAALLKQAAADRGPRGGGYWFAPHWWFVDSLGREEPRRGKDADTLRPVGPTFAEAFGPRARQHLHAVLRAVQVDMVFVEDGVTRKAVDRVLRALFEVYDVHGGRRKAEDHHFRGIPKVRVMLHEYAPGRKFQAARGYKEPGFDDLSRARVLHVFKDRGGQEDEIDAPFDSSWEPAPALGVG